MVTRRVLPWRSLRIATVYGSTSVGAQAKRARAERIVVATPGRLNDPIERHLVRERLLRGRRRRTGPLATQAGKRGQQGAGDREP